MLSLDLFKFTSSNPILPLSIFLGTYQVKFELNSSQPKFSSLQIVSLVACDHSTFFLDEFVQYFRISAKRLDQLVIPLMCLSGYLGWRLIHF
jgi:hypothetical protein